VVRCTTTLKTGVQDVTVAIRGDFHSQGSVLRGDAHGHCDRISLEVRLTAPAEVDRERVRRAVRLAHELCYAEVALRPDLVHVTHVLNGDSLDGA
jgi:uncharacterized OsmC-like protein